jgi:hypothetical protein
MSSPNPVPVPTSVAEGVTEGVKEGVKNTRDGIMKGLTNDSIIIILVVCAMVIIILITIYIIRIFKKSNLKETKLTSKIIQLDDKKVIPYKIPGGKMAVSNRGQEFSYTFWIYLGEYATTVQHKLVYQRGADQPTDNDVSISYTANPIIALDKGTNKLMFALSTSKASGTNTLDAIFNKSANYITSRIDYIPLHRWVFASMVLRDNIMTIYMDGDIYSVTTTADLLVNSTDVRPIVNSTNGDAFIGSTKFSTLGFISKLSMYNYGLTQNQIRSLYNRGPVTKSLLSMFGIANYGVRSPIYNLSDVEGSGEQSTK